VSEADRNIGGACRTSFPTVTPKSKRPNSTLRTELGDVAILREPRGGVSRALMLGELRRRHRERSTVS